MVLTSSYLQEPHPPRLSAEEAANRLARLDTNSPSIFQNLDQLKAFFAEVVSEGIPLVLALVPHRQSHSFITQGSSDMLVSALGRVLASSLLPLPPNHVSTLLPTGDCERQWAAGCS